MNTRRIVFCVIFCSLMIFLVFSWPLIGQADGPIAHDGTLIVIGKGAGSPDDVAIGANDTVYFSDMSSNRVMRLTVNGQPEAVSPVIHEPEGIVPLSDNTLIVVEQATNRLYRVDPVAKTMVLFYSIGNKTANAGVDGLSRDASTGDLLIPDAPTGRILRLATDTHRLTTIASGFKRPTSVALAVDGTLFVCDEYGNAIYRVAANGKASIVAEMPLPDDLLIDASGNLIVNSLNGIIWRIDPVSGAKSELVTGLRSPHGIALDSHGNLIIADATLNQLYRLEFAAVSASTSSATP